MCAIIPYMSTQNISALEYNRLIHVANKPFVLKNWYIETFPLQWSMEYHLHPQIEIMYCSHGQFDFIYKTNKDDEPQSITISQNRFILVNTGYYHKIANLSPSTTIINLEYINPTNTSSLGIFSTPLKDLFPTCPELALLISKDKDFYVFIDECNIQNIMKDIIKRISTEEHSAEQSVFVSLLTTYLFMNMAHCPSFEANKKSGIKYIDTAVDYINSHLSKNITIKEIADAAGISSTYLQKLFKNQYQKTVHDFITEKKLAQAKNLLEKSSFSIADIAIQCGFGCREQLNYEYKKVYGISPAKHRKTICEKTIRHFSDYNEIKLPDAPSLDR